MLSVTFQNIWVRFTRAPGIVCQSVTRPDAFFGGVTFRDIFGKGQNHLQQALVYIFRLKKLYACLMYYLTVCTTQIYRKRRYVFSRQSNYNFLEKGAW